MYTPDLHHMHIAWITAIAQSLVVMVGYHAQIDHIHAHLSY